MKNTKRFIFPPLPKRYAELLWYALPSTLSQGSQFFLLPLYTRLISPRDFGLVGLAIITSGVLRMAVIPGMEGVYLRYGVFKEAGEKISGNLFFGTVFRIHLFIALVVIPLLFWPTYLLTQRYAPGIPVSFLICTIGSLVIGSLQAPWMAFLRMERRVREYSILLNIQGLLSVAITVFSLLILKWGALSLLIGDFITAWVILLLTVRGIRLGLEAKGQWDRVVGALRILISVGPESVAFWGFTAIDRFLINYYKGPEELGLFTASYQFCSLMVAITIIGNKQWQTLVFQSYRESTPASITVPKLYRNVLSLFFCLALLVGVAAFITTPIFFGAKYQAGKQLLPYMVMIGFLRIPSFFFSSVCWATERRKLLVGTNLLALAVFTLSNLILIPRFGNFGAVVSAAVAFSIFIIAIHTQKLTALMFSPEEFLLGSISFVAGFGGLAGLYYFGAPAAIPIIFCLLLGILLFNQGRKFGELLAQ